MTDAESITPGSMQANTQPNTQSIPSEAVADLLNGVEEAAADIERPVRVLVRRDSTMSARLRPEHELAQRTTVGDAYLSSLIRTQRILAMRFFVVLIGLLASVPLSLLVNHRLRLWKVDGVPVATILLWVGFYPLFVILSVAFVRRAERSEAEFVDLVIGKSPSNVSSVPSVRADRRRR
jgi:hypothetical protein